MSFDIFFGVFLKQRTWKLAAATAVAEIFSIKAIFNLAFQTGLILSVITYKTSGTWTLIFFTADAVYSAGGQ